MRRFSAMTAMGLALLGALNQAQAAPPIIGPINTLPFKGDGKIEFLEWHDKNEADNLTAINDALQKGYRVQSVGAFGSGTSQKFATVMVKQSSLLLPPEQKVAMRDISDTNAMASVENGWRLTKAAASGTRAIVVAEKSTVPSQLVVCNDVGAFNALNTKKIRQDQRLICLESFGSANAPKYIAIWGANPDGVAWNSEAIDIPVEDAQKRFDVMYKAHGALTQVAYTPANRFIQLWSDEYFGGMEARANLTSDGLTTLIQQQKNAGRVPICISAQDGNDARFAAVFADRIKPFPLNWQPQGSPPIAEVDEAVKQVMKDSNIRGASLAMCVGTKLVYVRAYTLAAPNYPVITPLTTFRQASVSKPFAATAVYRLINRGALIPDTTPPQKLTLDTPFQDVLQLTTPGGQAPTDPRFKTVTIRNLIAHRSGLTTGGIWSDQATANAFTPALTLPVSPEQAASYVASLTMDSDPGGPIIYNNTNTFLLGLVAAKMTKQTSAFSAIKQLVFTPLDLKTMAQSHTRIDNQGSNEAFYPPRMEFFESDGNSRRLNTWLAFSNDMTSPDAPICALGYGETNMENCTGSGGLSANAIDIVRLGAALADPDGAGLFSATDRKSYLDDTTSGGRYSFDKAKKISDGVYWGYKGGDLSTSQNMLYFNNSGVSYAICWSGRTPSFNGWYPQWDAIINPVKAKNWGNTDLFTDYGYKPLGTKSPLLTQYQPPQIALGSIKIDDTQVSPPMRSATSGPDLRVPTPILRPKLPFPILPRRGRGLR
ncbi:hypothetical protein IAD21_06242 [Abditibacteriota bacterium]|nr:hypothetical protein IAD21_06242 [Abditibacteriota bacterium]